MNLCASLGIGPGGRLLLPGTRPADSMLGLLPRSETVGPKETVERAPRVRRSRDDSKALQERVVAALRRNDGKAVIARREGIGDTYVAHLASIHGLAAPKRTRKETQALAAKVWAELHPEEGKAPRRCDVADANDISQPYLCAILKRYGYE